MLKFKSKQPYWADFSSYQTFQTTEEMIAQIKLFESTYELTPAVKAVLNTIKLHAKKTFVGVCWLYRDIFLLYYERRRYYEKLCIQISKNKEKQRDRLGITASGNRLYRKCL